MKGLLIKDLRLLLNQKKFYVLVFVIGFILFLNNDTPEAAMGYITIISSMLVITTMSYDEFENGLSFLMTLPITRVSYVWSKYILGVGLSAVMSVLTTLCAIFVFKMRGIPYPLPSFLHSGLLFFGVALLFLGVMIPVQLKFGAEKGRYAKIVVVFVAMGIAAGIVKLLQMLGIDVFLGLENILNASIFLGFAVITAFSMILYLVSAVISLRIMKKKEF